MFPALPQRADNTPILLLRLAQLRGDFETYKPSLLLKKSLHRQTSGAHRVPLPAMDGLSPIADVDRETESSFNTQYGDLGLPDLDVSYGTPQDQPGQREPCDHLSPSTQCEPLAYLG